MRRPFPETVEAGRMRLDGIDATLSKRGDPWGLFQFQKDLGAPPIRVVCSPGADEVPWEHVSVSLQTRCPTWDEMCWIKDLFFEDEETVLQFHPPKSEYVDFHPFCLHLWRPIHFEQPTPPTIAIGPKGVKGPRP